MMPAWNVSSVLSVPRSFVATKHSHLSVMVAGIGGASLGTELLKCLQLANRYLAYGCDISPTAYGLYDSGFKKTFLVDRGDYVGGVIKACQEAGTKWLIPGGEQPTALLSAATIELAECGIRLVGNDKTVVATFSDKASTFESLAALGVPVPKTLIARPGTDLASVGLPCIVKPATGSGGSAMVFFAIDLPEAEVYADYIRRMGGTPLVQEYICVEAGEFTVGVLSLPDGKVAGSVALRRSFDAKLSVLSRGRGGLVSSGYSQGYIGNFPEIREQAEAIAKAIGSCGPINIQGRMRDGHLIPFEINPRVSASTYLRALAGFNEVDLLLQHLAFAAPIGPPKIREGWYLRSLTEEFVAPGEVRR